MPEYKYKIKKTDILHDGKIYPEGSEITLEKDKAKSLDNYLTQIAETKPEKPPSTNKTPETVKSKNKKKTAKNKKTDNKPENPEPETKKEEKNNATNV